MYLKLHVQLTTNKLRANQAAARLLDIRHGDFIFMFTTEEAVRAQGIADGLKGTALNDYVKKNIVFAIAKSVSRKRDGVELKAVKILSTKEKEAYLAGEYKGELDTKEITKEWPLGRPIEPDFYGAKTLTITNRLLLAKFRNGAMLNIIH